MRISRPSFAFKTFPVIVPAPQFRYARCLSIISKCPLPADNIPSCSTQIQLSLAVAELQLSIGVALHMFIFVVAQLSSALASLQRSLASSLLQLSVGSAQPWRRFRLPLTQLQPSLALAEFSLACLQLSFQWFHANAVQKCATCFFGSTPASFVFAGRLQTHAIQPDVCNCDPEVTFGLLVAPDDIGIASVHNHGVKLGCL